MADQAGDPPESMPANYQARPVDRDGCPLVEPSDTAARYAPSAPCRFCPGHHPADRMDSFAWCQQMDTCAATIDWERIYGHW